VPAPKLLLPAAFCSANLIIYWGGFDTTWKLVCAVVVGLLLFVLGAWRAQTGAERAIRNAIWIGPWLAGQVLIGWLGRYGNAARNIIPAWFDIAIVLAFALAIFYWAVSLAHTQTQATAAVEKDSTQIEAGA
jgi:hypothetical protein